MFSKVQEMLMDKNADSDSLLETVARRESPIVFKAMLTCLKELLSGEQVRKIFP